jgi:AraC-like DNA-binding protein
VATGRPVGHLLVGPGYAIYLGPLLENEAHAHHAVQVSIALEDAFTLQAAPDPRWPAYRAAVTGPDRLHRIRCHGPIAQIYLDPEGGRGLALRDRLGDASVQAIDADDLGSAVETLRSGLTEDLGTEQVAGIVDSVAGVAAPGLSSNDIDPRVRKALHLVHAVAGRQLSLDALAERVMLSPSRLGALFCRDVGIPVRRYLLWLRLIDAVEELADGPTLTAAAHDAAFSDSAHLSRTFRRMFGMPPSALRSKQVRIHRVAAATLPTVL